MAKQENKPSTVFRIGSVGGSIFEHEVDSEAGKGPIRCGSLQRRYNDGNENEYSSSFGIADIPLAIRVLQATQQHVEDAEAEVLPE